MHNNFFYYSLLFSFCAHVVFILWLSFSRPPYLDKNLKRVEVSYVPLKQSALKVKANIPKDILTEKKIPLVKKIETPGSFVKPEFMKNISHLDKRVNLDLKESVRFEKIQSKLTVTMPVIDSTKISNPRYIGYTNRLREKISRQAVHYTNTMGFEEGEVYVTFAISRDGILRGVKIIDLKTEASDKLRGIALRSVRDSSPFSSFPPELGYPELTFNVIISFQGE